MKLRKYNDILSVCKRLTLFGISFLSIGRDTHSDIALLLFYLLSTPCFSKMMIRQIAFPPLFLHAKSADNGGQRWIYSIRWYVFRYCGRLFLY
jgi:hypothetical protein